jgi:hypothetical protein
MLSPMEIYKQTDYIPYNKIITTGYIAGAEQIRLIVKHVLDHDPLKEKTRSTYLANRRVMTYHIYCERNSTERKN